jgi:NAD(P)-dependent dehydrogenase (short-subunit alcohol dehydrogenase family)
MQHLIAKAFWGQFQFYGEGNEIMKNRVAIVTASGRGIGAAAARKLHAEGYHLGLISPSGSAEELAKELGNSVGVTGSVTDSKDLERLFDLTLNSFGRLDVVVNNSGHPPKADLMDVTDEQWQRGYEMILKLVIETTRLALPHFQRQGSGSIVNLSAFAAYEPSLNFPVSSVFRAALGSYTRLFGRRFAKDGIRMNSILPGFINSFPVNEEILADIPAGRYGKVEEVADLVYFLASEQSAYITGESIRIDGGMSRSI